MYGVVGAPIAFQTFDPQKQPSQFLLSGAVGTGVVVLLAILRIYLGWAVRTERVLAHQPGGCLDVGEACGHICSSWPCC